MKRSLRIISCTILSAAIGSGPVAAQEVAGVTPPRTVSPQEQQLSLAGCDSRQTLWMEIYAVALYLPNDDLRPSKILDSNTAKAVRLYPVYEGEMPKRIPDAWRQRLSRQLSPAHFDIVQRYFDRMSSKDVATAAYQPEKGTVLMINNNVYDQVQGHEMMKGILQTWIGPTASGDNPIKLLSGAC